MIFETYREVLDKWYPNAMSYGFKDPYELAVDFANELGTAQKVDIWQLRMLTTLLHEFGGEKLPTATSFEQDAYGRIFQTTYDLEEQLAKEKQTLEHVAKTFKVNLDDGSADWDDVLDFNDTMTKEEKWERLDGIIVFERDRLEYPTIYVTEFVDLKTVLVEKHRLVAEQPGA